LIQSESKDEMIHADNDIAFRLASSSGHIEVLKLFLEHTSDQQQKDQMIHSQNDEAFRSASSIGNIEVLKLLVEHTPNQQLKEQMIHSENDEAFQNAARREHFVILRYLLELTPKQWEKDRMIFEDDTTYQLSFHMQGYYSEEWKFLLLEMSDDSFVKALQKHPQKVYIPKIIHLRKKMKITSLCSHFNMNSDFVEDLSNELLDQLTEDLKQRKLFRNFSLVVSSGLKGFQTSLHPNLPTEIFLNIISYATEVLITKISPTLQNLPTLEKLINHYQNFPKKQHKLSFLYQTNL